MTFKKDLQRKFWFITTHHHPTGELIGNINDDKDHYDVSDIIECVDEAFTGNLRFRRGTLEIGAEEGKLHMHFYVECHKSVRWSTLVKRTECMNAKVQVVTHSADRVFEYCGKDGDPTWLAGPYDEGFRRPQRIDQKTESVLDEVIDRLQDGIPISEVARTYPKTWVMFGRRLKEWMMDAGLTEERITRSKDEWVRNR